MSEMARTDKFTITSGEWTRLSDGEENVGIQLISHGQILVHVGETEPSPDAPGILIGRESQLTPYEFSVSALPNTARVYARAKGDRNIDIVVMRY